MVTGVSIRDFAKLAGCDTKVVTRKMQSGHLPRLATGKLDPRHAALDWRSGVAPIVDAVDSVDNTVDSETLEETADRIVNVEGRARFSKAEAERVKENYLALLRQLEYDREAGAVVEISDVATAVVGEYALVRNKLLNIGSRIAPRAAVMRSAEEVKALVDAEVALALEELTLDGNGSSRSELRGSIRDRFGKTSS